MAVDIVPHLDFPALVDGLGEGGWLGGNAEPEPLPVVVPSVSFGDELRTRIAGRYGVCMGLDFQTPGTFLSRVFEGVDEGRWTRRRLVWRILPEVEKLVEEGPLVGWRPSVREAFALADLLADRMDQYGHGRPEMIREWAAGRDVVFRVRGEEMGAAQEWQRGLFERLGGGEGHPAVGFARLRGDAGFLRDVVARYPRVLVLGSGALDPLLVELLGVMGAAGSEVRIRLVLPSLGYLGDLLGRGRLPELGSLPGEFGVEGEDAVPEGHPGDDAVPEGHPLLQTMGRHAVGGFLLLGTLDENYTGWPEPGEVEGMAGDDGGTLLGRLQSDLRALRSPVRRAVGDGDVSLRVHSCFGARREMECLRDELLRAFRDIPDLRPDEVLVMAPSLEEYGPLVPGILGEAGLPVRLTELPPGEMDALTEAVLFLLGVVQEGRYGAGEFLELLRLRAVRGRLEFQEENWWNDARVCEWVRSSGLTHGLGDAEGGEEQPGTWRFALDRMLAGYWLGKDRGQSYPEGGFVLPVGGGESDMERLGDFMGWWGRLWDLLRDWKSPVAPGMWADRLELMARECLTSGSDESGELSPELAFLREYGGEVAIDAGTLLDWLARETGTSGRRVLTTGRIAFGRFKQLQSVPCRVLALVGLQDGNFPSSSRVPSWDLLAGNPRWWDRNPSRDDRQLFLDALLTVRERVILTASNRDVRSGVTGPFSSCVEELLRVLERMGAERSRVVVEHALQPFRREYFDSKSGWPLSFDGAAARVVAESGGRLERPVSPFWNEDGGEEGAEKGGLERREISGGELVRFWKNPAGGFLRAHGIWWEGIGEGDEALDRGPLEMNQLGRWRAKREWIEAELHGAGASEHLRALLEAGRELPPGELGMQEWEMLRGQCELVVAALRHCWGEEAEVAVELGEGDAGRVRIFDRVRLNPSGEELLAWSPGEFKKASHFFEAWMGSLISSASGRPRATRLFYPGQSAEPWRLPAPKPEEARRILEILWSGYLAGRERPLPFMPMTSEALIEKLAKGGEPARALDAARAEWGRKDGGYGGGEGLGAEARLAWRDRDAWADAGEWLDWAQRVSEPLWKWRNPE